MRLVFGAIIVVAFGVGALWLLVPPPAGVDKGQFYSPFGTPTTLVDLTFALGGGILFLLALRNFKKELKPAYRLVAGAQFSLGILTIVFPIIEYYNLWDNVYWDMSSYLSYLVGCVLMYLGARQFMKIIGTRSLATAPLVVIVATLAISVARSLTPHVNVWAAFNEHQYDAFEVAVTIPVVFYAAAAYGMFKIRRTIGQEYRRSFDWLAAGLVLQMITAITIAVLDTIGYDNWYFNTRMYELPTILGDFLVLVAAYQFNVVGEVTRARYPVWKRVLHIAPPPPPTSIDIVVYAAGMASNLEAINPILDRMRHLTASLAPNQDLSKGEQAELRSIYLDLETYLVTKEPLRTFTRETIRRNITAHFALGQGAAPTFWPAL